MIYGSGFIDTDLTKPQNEATFALSLFEMELPYINRIVCQFQNIYRFQVTSVWKIFRQDLLSPFHFLCMLHTHTLTYCVCKRVRVFAYLIAADCDITLDIYGTELQKLNSPVNLAQSSLSHPPPIPWWHLPHISLVGVGRHFGS